MIDVQQKKPWEVQYKTDTVSVPTSTVPTPELSEEDSQSYLSNKDRIDAALNAPFKDIYEGFNKLKEDPLTGTGQILRGVGGELFSPITMAIEGWKSVPIVGKGIANLLTAAPEFSMAVAKTGLSISDFLFATAGWTPEKETELLSKWLGITEEQAKEGQKVWRENLETVAQIALMAGAPAILKEIPERAIKSGAKHAAKLGKLRGAGESPDMMRRAGQFASEFDIPRAKPKVDIGTAAGEETFTSEAKIQAQDIVKKLSTELNDKIIDPATEQGHLISGKTLITRLENLRDEHINSATPSQRVINVIDRMIQSTKNRLAGQEVPGYFTPAEAQRLKIQNNDILKRFYEDIEKNKSIGPLDVVEKQALSKTTEGLRTELERIFPPIVGRVNWTQGAALDLMKAAEQTIRDNFSVEQKARAGVGVSATGRPHVWIGELVKFKAFRDAYHKFMTGIMKGVSGRGSEFIKPGEIPELRPPPFEGFPNTGPMLPPSSVPPSGGALPQGGGNPALSEGQKALPQNSAEETANYNAEKEVLDFQDRMKKQFEVYKQKMYDAGLPYGDTPEAYKFGEKMTFDDARMLWEEYNREKSGIKGSYDKGTVNQLKGEAVAGYIAKQKGVEPKTLEELNPSQFFEESKKKVDEQLLLSERTWTSQQKPAPVFHLKSEEVIQSVPNTIKAQSLKNQLNKLGISKDEMTWTKIDDLVNSKKPNDVVSRQELTDWIEKNKIEINPIEIKNNYSDEIAKQMFGKTFAELDKEQKSAVIKDIHNTDFVLPKFEQHNPFETGDNPREILLQVSNNPESIAPGSVGLPIIKGQKLFTGGHYGDVAHNVAAHIRMWDLQRELGKVENIKPGLSVSYKGNIWKVQRITGSGNYVRLIQEGFVPEKTITVPSDELENITSDLNKNKILGIGEIQSDWNIQGRKSGFNVRGKLPEGFEVRKITNEELPDFGHPTREGSWGLFDKDGSGIVSVGSAGRTYEQAYEEALRSAAEEGGIFSASNVPDFPFKGTAWAELSLKYILRYAAEKGYDKIVFSSPEQVKSLYDLSKHVESINWFKGLKDKADNKTYDLEIMRRGEAPNRGEGIPNVKESELEKYVGKDVASRIIKERRDRVLAGSHIQGTLNNLDLKIGGEWADKLYGKTLPDILNKLGKEYGVKIEKVSEEFSGNTDYKGPVPPDTKRPMVSGENISFTLTPKMKSDILRRGFQLGFGLILLNMLQGKDADSAQTR